MQDNMLKLASESEEKQRVLLACKTFAVKGLSRSHEPVCRGTLNLLNLSGLFVQSVQLVQFGCLIWSTDSGGSA